jgi:hypothetical protein
MSHFRANRARSAFKGGYARQTDSDHDAHAKARRAGRINVADDQVVK